MAYFLLPDPSRMHMKLKHDNGDFDVYRMQNTVCSMDTY